MSITGSRIELASFDNQFWQDVNPTTIDHEDVVAKMHLIDVLEGMSPYRTRADYSQRVFNAVSQLQGHSDINSEKVEAALVLFSNVFYVTQQMYEDAWRSLYRVLLSKLHPRARMRDDQNLAALSRVHFFENDPSGMFGKLCHINGVQGRLDNEKFSKINDVDKLGRTVLDIELNDVPRRKRALNELKKIFSKRQWVMLVDKSLSGHSLSSDLERLCRLINLRAEADRPELIVLGQVMTDQALRFLQNVDELKPFFARKTLTIYRAVRLADRHSILSDAESRVVRGAHIHKEAIGLCQWFAKNFIASDTSLDRMRERSGDDLDFGYRRCGLLLSDHQNCPTDSIPLLWHSVRSDSFQYDAPYQRVHSRIGNQTREPVADMWTEIFSSDRIIAVLRSLEH